MAKRRFWPATAGRQSSQESRATKGTAASDGNSRFGKPAEAELVREVFRQYLAGSGAKSTARNINQRGLLYRKHLWTRDLARVYL